MVLQGDNLSKSSVLRATLQGEGEAADREALSTGCCGAQYLLEGVGGVSAGDTTS